MGIRKFFRRSKHPLLHVAVDRGHGPAVVLIHGIASSSVTFDNLVPLLVSRRRVIAIDLLGFGLSPSPPDATYTPDEHVAALATTIKSLRISGPITVVGHSLGALIAARYVAEHPAKIGHLVLVAPPVYVPGDTVLDPFERLQMDAYGRLYDFMRSNQGFTEASAKALSRLLPIRNALEVSEHNWRAISLSLEKCIESQTTVTDIAQVTAPVDVIYGTRDVFVPPAGVRFIERLRGVATTRVEGEDHLVRPGLAKEIARLVDSPSPPTTPVRVVTVRA